MISPPTTDVVLVDAIQLSVNIGADCWDRLRNQPVNLSVYLHLQPSFFDTSGQSDNVADSIHYGHLTKDISTLSESSYDNVRALISDATMKSFHHAVRTISWIDVRHIPQWLGRYCAYIPTICHSPANIAQ